MAYPIDEKLVVAISSTALFDFSKEHEIYLKEGLDAFRAFQRENRDELPIPGSEFPFIKRLLHLNKIFPDQITVEVVLLSRNHPDAGLRMMDALPKYDLDISRAFFLAGGLTYPYMKAVNACLYLNTDKGEVKEAIENGYPAGHVLPCKAVDDDGDKPQIFFDDQIGHLEPASESTPCVHIPFGIRNR